jgi:hypothetical protein
MQAPTLEWLSRDYPTMCAIWNSVIEIIVIIIGLESVEVQGVAVVAVVTVARCTVF